MAKLYKLRFELIDRLLYSSHLALCDFFLFPNLNKGWKKWLKRDLAQILK